MNFFQPLWAYGFLGILALAFFLLHAKNVRKKMLGRFAQPHLLAELIPVLDEKKRLLKLLLLLSALTCCIAALMRPQWGSRLEKVRKRGLDIIVAVDVSKSMLSEDVLPSRLGKTKLAIHDLVSKLDGDRIGLVVFAADAFLACPLTTDYGGFFLSLDALDISSAARGGTSIAGAIRTALGAFESAAGPHNILAVVTDGEDHEGEVLEAAGEAKNKNTVIFTVGVGTEEGDLIPAVDKSGQRAFLKDKTDRVVKTRLNESLLQDIARRTGGAYARSTQKDSGLDILYDRFLSKIEKKETDIKTMRLYQERFQVFLSIALCFLLGELFVSEFKVPSSDVLEKT